MFLDITVKHVDFDDRESLQQIHKEVLNVEPNCRAPFLNDVQEDIKPRLIDTKSKNCK